METTARRVWIPLTVALLSLVALGPMPFGYYQLLRVVVCAACVYLLMDAASRLGHGHRVALSALVVLYNPILLVPLDSKPIWSLVNFGTVVFLWALATRAAGTKEQAE